MFAPVCACRLAWVDLLVSDAAEGRSLRPLLTVGQPCLPAVLPFAGDGSFVSPFHLDLSETLSVAVLSLLGPDFLDMAIGLNNQLRALAGPTLAVGLVNASTGRKKASKRGGGGGGSASGGRSASSAGSVSAGSKGLGVRDADTRLALLREESSSAGMIIGIGSAGGASGAGGTGAGDGPSGGPSSSFRVIDATGRQHHAAHAGRALVGAGGAGDGGFSPLSLGTGSGGGGMMGGLASPLSDALLYGDGGGGDGGDYASGGDLESGGASPGLARGKVYVRHAYQQQQINMFTCSGSAANVGRPVQRQRALRRVFEFVAVLNDTLQARSEGAAAALAALQTVRAEVAARRAARDGAAAARAAEAAQVQWASAAVVSPGGVRSSLPGAPAAGSTNSGGSGSGSSGADGAGGAAGGGGATADASGGRAGGDGAGGGMERSHSSASDAISAHSYWTSDAEAAMMAAAAEDAADAQHLAEAEAALRDALRWVPFGFGQPGGEVTLFLGVLGGHSHSHNHVHLSSSASSTSSASHGKGAAATAAAGVSDAAAVPPRPCLLVLPRGCPPPDADGRFPFPLAYGAVAVRPVSRSAFEILTAALSRTRAGAAAAAATAAAASAAAAAGSTPGSGGSVTGSATGSDGAAGQRGVAGSGGSTRALSIGGSSSPYLGGPPMGYGHGYGLSGVPGHSRPTSLTSAGRRGSMSGGLGGGAAGAGGSVVSGGSGGRRKAGSDSGAAHDGVGSGAAPGCCARFSTLLCVGAARAWATLPTLRNAPASGSAAVNSLALLALLVANSVLTLLCLAGYAQLARPFLWPLLLLPPGGLPAAALLGHVAAGLHSARLHRAHAALEVLALLPVLLAACFGAGLAAKGTFDWPLGVAVPAALALVKLMLLRLAGARVALLDLQQELDAHATGPVAYVRELFAAQAVAVAAASAASGGGASGASMASHALVSAAAGQILAAQGGQGQGQGHGDLRSFLPNAGAAASGLAASAGGDRSGPGGLEGGPMMMMAAAAGGELDSTTGAIAGSYHSHAAGSLAAGAAPGSAHSGAGAFPRVLGAGPGPSGRGLPMSDLSFAMHGAGPMAGLAADHAGAVGGLGVNAPQDMLSMGNEW